MEKIETIEHKGYSIDVMRDESPESPNDWGDDNLFLVGYDSRNFWVEREGFSEGHVRAMLAGGKYEDGSVNSDAAQDRKKYRMFAVHPYTHSGTTLRLGGYYAKKMTIDEAYSVRIDSVAFIARSEWPNERKALDAAAGLINEWNDYLSGSVYGYTVTDPDGETVGACGGFYGYPYTDMITEAKAEADARKEERDQKRQRAAEEFIQYGTVYDNGGKSFDRYTVVYDGDAYGMSVNAKSPQGFNQAIGPAAKFALENNPAVGERVMFSSLPKEVQEAIIDNTIENPGSYVFNPDVCSSSLGEDDKPMTPGETAHKFDPDTGICDECGSSKD